jgi:hypothetical protein
MDTYVFWAVVFFLATGAVAIVVQLYFTRRVLSSIPAVTHAFVAFGTFICFMPFPLLALDIDAALSARDIGQKSSADSWVHGWWMTMFFATNILGWVVLPILQSFDESGEFTTKKKLIWSFRENVRLYIILGIVAVLALGYLIFIMDVHDISGVVSLCLACANAFGLIVLVIFLGCGLFGFPRRVWKLSDPIGLLQEEYHAVRDYNDDLDSALLDLAALRVELAKMDPNVLEADRPHFVKMLEIVADIQRVHPSVPSSIRDSANKSKTYASLAVVNMELRRLKKLIRRLDSLLNTTVDRCVELDHVIAKGSWFWTVGRKPLFRIAAIAALLLSLFVLTSEIVIPFNHMTGIPLSIMQVLVLNPVTRFVSSMVVLCYIASCAFWSTAKFKVFDTYVLVPGTTDAATLCFFVTFLTRLIMPLCYNFLLMADIIDPQYGVTYSRLFGSMNVVVLLGTWFNRFMPIFIPIVAVLIELGIIHRMLAWAGFESFEVSEEGKVQRQQNIEEGRMLVAQKKGVELRTVTVGTEMTPGNMASSIASTISNVVAPTDPAKEKAEKERRYAEWKAKQREKGETA